MFRSKARLLIVFLMLIPNIVFANQLLNQIKNSINTPQIIRGKFVQNRALAGVSKKLVSEGYFLVDKQRGILWATEKPIYQALAVTDAGISIKNKSSTLMNLDSRNQPSVKYINELMLAIFSVDMNAIERVFDYTGEVTSKGWSLNLTQKNISSAVFKNVVITGGSVISRITFTSKEGDVTDIVFTEVKPIAALTTDEILQFQ